MKTAGLTLLVTLLVAVAAAPSVLAVEFEATSSPGTLSGYGGGFEEIITEAGAITCEESSFSGSYEEEFFETLRLHADFADCDAFGFINATVDTEACDFLYTPTTYFALFIDAEMGIDCWSGTVESIKVTAATCSIEIPESEANWSLSSVTIYHGGGAIGVRPELEEIHYVVTNDGFLCPFAGEGEREDGAWVSEEAVSVTTSSGSIDIID